MSVEVSIEDLEALERELEGIATPPPAPTPAPAPSGQLKQFLDPAVLRRDLAYNEATIGEATMQQASLFFEYARLASLAAHQHDTSKNALEIVEATIDKELRDQATETGTKVTEAALSKAISLDPRYQKAQRRVSDAKLISSLCDQAREAFRQRMFMLIQAGKDQMIERQGELRQNELNGRRDSMLREMASA